MNLPREPRVPTLTLHIPECISPSQIKKATGGKWDYLLKSEDIPPDLTITQKVRKSPPHLLVKQCVFSICFNIYIYIYIYSHQPLHHRLLIDFCLGY